MNTHWIPLQSIPAAGKQFVLDDKTLWQEPLHEFGIDCRILTPLRAEIFVLPQEQGVLFRGLVTGSVALPCDRCADDSTVVIHHSFDSFEPYPSDSLMTPARDGARKSPERRGHEPADASDDAAEIDDIDDAVIRNAAHGRGVEINPAALAWEELSLALPVKPLCHGDCKGLCPVCGCNRNTDSCTCGRDQGDPRLAALRGLHVGKK